MNERAENIKGRRFGRLVVLRRSPNKTDDVKRWRAFWDCVCDCGKKISTRADQLKSGITKSCGCLKIELWTKKLVGNQNNKTHGLHKHPLYKIWGSMKTRCYNPKAKNYPDYGGRGIKVCDRWLNSFPNFLEDMGERPAGAKKLTLDRKEVNGDYTPDNCRWATYAEQRKNTRKMRVLQAQLDDLIKRVRKAENLLESHGIIIP